MKIENLKIFITVARTENMHKAAEVHFTSYQNISFIIKNMEKELGFSLFVRDNKGMRLTAEGAEFFQLVAPFVRTYEEFLIRQSTKDDLQIFHMYTTPIMEPYVRRLQDMIYSDYYYCSLKKSTVNEMMEMISRKQFGIYLVPGFKGHIKEILAQENGIILAKDKNIIVCHRNNEILQGGLIDAETIKKMPRVQSGGKYIGLLGAQTVLDIDDVTLCKRYLREKGFIYSTTQFIFNMDFTEQEEWIVMEDCSDQLIEYNLIFLLPERQIDMARHFFLAPLQQLFLNKL